MGRINAPRASVGAEGTTRDIEMPKLPAGYGFDDDQVGHFARYVLGENIPANVATHLMEWYADRFCARGTLVEQDYADFARDFAGRLSEKQIALLTRWAREELHPS